MNKKYTVTGVLVDVVNRQQYGAEITIENGRIAAIENRPGISFPYIIPGFTDAHVHIESSMLIPSRFARLAVKHGTVGVVTDPHEVANVAGIPGVEFMIANGKTVPMQFFFGAPSCVPASPMEKSGAVITADDVKQLLQRPEFWYLSEMMNFPGVIFDDQEVKAKLQSAVEMGKPVDGHAPGLMGDDLLKYVKSGISTDHECSTREEAREKLALGMKVLIREGSAARNFDNLIPLLKTYSEMLMFCTDDCHPDYLLRGHINKLASRAVKAGYDLYDVLKVACVNPVKHYRLPLGLLQPGDSADFAVVENLEDFDVISVHIKGIPVFELGQLNFGTSAVVAPPFPFRSIHDKGQLKVVATGSRLNVIKAIDGELITKWHTESCVQGEEIKSDPENDLLKLVLLNRYDNSPPVVAFIKGFGLKEGALACSVAHDSHHIIAVGCDDVSLDNALQWVVENRGGMCSARKDTVRGVALPFFGLMTDKNGEQVAADYEHLTREANDSGSTLSSPFMTLSFMALTVIPHLKINHNGLFDGNTFKNIELFTC
ncbi:MAG: adenine deaminase [Bacteroidota bacterium]